MILGFGTDINHVTYGDKGASSQPITSGGEIAPYSRSGVGNDNIVPPITDHTFTVNPNYSGNEIWLTGHIYRRSDIYETQTMLQINDTNGNLILKAAINTGEALAFTFYNGTTTIGLSGTCFLTSYTRHRIDIRLKAEVDGALEVYRDGTLVSSYYGDTSTTRGKAKSVSFVGGKGSLANYWSTWSGLFMADEDTRFITMIVHTLTGDGTHHQDAEGSYEGVDHIAAIDDSAPVIIRQSDQTQTFTFDATPAAFDAYDVVGVGIASRSSAPETAPVNQITHVAANGTNTIEGQITDLNAGKQPTQSILNTDPDGQPWTIATANSAEFGIRGKSSN